MHLIGSGKTRLSGGFQNLISPENDEAISLGLRDKKIIYFSAFAEDLFFWYNDLEQDLYPHPKRTTRSIYVTGF